MNSPSEFDMGRKNSNPKECHCTSCRSLRSFGSFPYLLIPEPSSRVLGNKMLPPRTVQFSIATLSYVPRSHRTSLHLDKSESRSDFWPLLLAGCRLVDDTHYDYHSCCLHFSFPNPIWAGSVCCCAGTGRPGEGRKDSDYSGVMVMLMAVHNNDRTDDTQEWNGNLR